MANDRALERGNTRDLAKSIPKGTEALVIVLGRVSHALARKVRTEATRRSLPVFFQRFGRQIHSADTNSTDLTQWLDWHTQRTRHD